MAELILEGGAMRAGFVAGALMALMDNGLTDFDRGLAVSASVPTLAYFASGQRKEIEEVWRLELCSSDLVCYHNLPATSLALSIKRPIIDIQHLVYDVFKEKYPLNIKNLFESRMDCRFALTQAPQGSLVLVRPADYNIYEIFKAALAVPGCYPGTVCLGGFEFIDGGTVNPLPARLWSDEGVEKIICILSKPLDCKSESLNLIERILFFRYFMKYDWVLGRLEEAGKTYQHEISYLERLAKEEPARAFIIHPERMPRAGFITRDLKKINSTIDMGYRQVEKLVDQIRDFLEE
ncbi:MAG: patatin-like phospholipase family protein [Desulfatiglans sp.]|jgi:predicted patatin/cPLA2 family phospholipase|nr:hypothetical protein [Thermodesulfobacteriota bacterium]MEE4352287.1 patatin-like phospholipase family protein [Desulfatiglans sp.]